MKRVKDLVHIAEVDTVIHVATAECMSEHELEEKIIGSFVVTDDLLKGLDSILFSLRKEHGTGFLVKGNYGSGKSHFIAFLASLFLYPDMLGRVKFLKPEILASKDVLKAKKVLPVFLTLGDYSVVNSLSDIVMEKISERLQKNGVTGILGDSGKIVEDFKNIMLPNISDDFFRYLRSINKEEFDSIEKTEQTIIIINFFKQKNIPFRPYIDYQEFFEKLQSAISDSYPVGLFLLIDELSEFLRARNRGDLVSEDIRFIQFIGEKTKNTNVRVLFSMQESIEEVAEISTESLNRIKDRFPVRINLTAMHLQELVEKRLLLKAEGSIPFIDDIYLSLADSFPDWKIKQDNFRSIYPVHPATFTMLESITGLFSKTRGMVDFIVSEIRGDASRGIQGIMEQDASTLVYPDRVFDHFRNSLEESLEYNRLISTVYSRIERDASKIFQKSEDALIAKRIIKLILLFQITPGTGKPSAKELAHLVMENRFKLDPEFNYRYIREKILKVLEGEYPFIGTDNADNPLEDRFFLRLEENPRTLYENRVKQFINKNVNIEKLALWFFISRMKQPELPIAQFRDMYSSIFIKFENTVRQGFVILKSPDNLNGNEIATMWNMLHNDEFDFSVIVGFPLDEQNEMDALKKIITDVNSPLAANIFFWKPKIANEKESTTLATAYARIKVFESDYQHGTDKTIHDAKNESELEAYRIIKELYASAHIYSINDNAITSHELLFTGSFDKTVEMFVRDSLKKVFHNHHKIMPLVEITTAESFNQVIKLFREKTEIDFTFEGNRIVKNTIDALLKNSGLLKILRNQYTILPEPAKNSFLKDLLHEIEKKSHSFHELYNYFRKGTYGIQKELFCIYLSFLAYSGFIMLKKSGRTLNPDSLDLKSVQSSELISTGDNISSLFMERYQDLLPFSAGLNSKNIHLQAQNQVWEKLIIFKQTEEERIILIRKKLDEIASYALFRDNPLQMATEAYNRLLYLLSKIKTSKSPRDGLDSLLEALDNVMNIEGDLETHKKVSRFFNQEMEQVVYIYDYITSPDLFIGDDEGIKSSVHTLIAYFRDIDGIVVSGRVEMIIEKFNSFKNGYKTHYIRQHGKVHAPGIMADYEKIKTSPAYHVLINLAKIETISVKDDLVRIDSLFRAQHLAVCQRAVSRELDRKPFCECRLKREEFSASLNDLAKMIKDGIIQYINALKEDNNHKKIINYMGALMTTEENEKREMLKNIMNIDPEKTSGSEMLHLIHRDSIELINRALSGDIRIVKKHVKEFYNSIFGRRFKKKDIQDIFNEWLKTEALPNEEIIYEITGFDEDREKNNVLPALLIDELRKAIPVEDENLKMQIFALALLIFPVAEKKYATIIDKTLCVNTENYGLKQIINFGSALVPHSINWEQFFSVESLRELMENLSLAEKTAPELCQLFNSAVGFISIREAILKKIMYDEIVFTEEARALFKQDGSTHAAIMSLCFDIELYRKKYYRESGKNDSFNQEFFIAAFSLLYTVESITWLSLNNNILIDVIINQMDKLKNNIQQECTEYFSAHVAQWETEASLQVTSLVAELKSNNPVFLIIDSLRYDLFLEMQKIFQDAEIKRRHTQAFLAPCPSDTLTFRDHLFPGIELSSGLVFNYQDRNWIFISAAERDYKKEDLWNFITSHEDAAIIIAVNILDEKVHSTKQHMVSLAKEFSLFCTETLVPLIKAIPHRRKIYMVADHGFIEHKQYSGQDEPRYSHGGNSFYERIIPFAEYEAKK